MGRNSRDLKYSREVIKRKHEHELDNLHAERVKTGDTRTKVYHVHFNGARRTSGRRPQYRRADGRAPQLRTRGAGGNIQSLVARVQFHRLCAMHIRDSHVRLP